MDTNNIVTVTKFNYKDNDYYAITTIDSERKIGKTVLDSDYNEINENSDMVTVQLSDGIKLNDEEKNTFIKDIKVHNKKQDKIEHKAEKKFNKFNKDSDKDEYMKEFLDLDTVEKRNQYLNDKGIEAGQIYEIKTQSINYNTGEKEDSVAYFEVFVKKDGNLALRPDKKDADLKEDTNFFQVGNAARLSGISALALLSDKFASNKLNAEFNKTKQDDRNFSDYEITFKRNNITSSILKKREEEHKKVIEALKKKRNNDKYATDTKDVLFSKVPDRIKKIYEEKNRNIDEKLYTDKVFDMFVKIASIPPEDRNISVHDQKVFSDILNKLKDNSDDNEKQKKIFNQWVFDNDSSNSDRLITLANLFEKTHTDSFTGYNKYRSEHDIDQREKNLEALRNNNLPFMTPKDNVDYIHSTDDNKIYEGETQLALQRNNLTNGYNTDCYQKLPDLINQNVLGNKQLTSLKVSCEIVDLGKDQYGHNHYQLLVPVKPKFSERLKEFKESRKLSKMEKDLRNEEYRRNVNDALFKKKYGNLPQYETSVQPVPLKQPPLVEYSQLKTMYEKPTAESSVTDKLKYDLEKYFQAMFTKTPFRPYTDWTQQSEKENLEVFIKNNPDKYRKIAQETYQNVQNQVRSIYRSNSNTNVETNENENVKDRGHTFRK